MKKTDIGVVAFIYAVCLLFLVMTLRLPSAAQTYPQEQGKGAIHQDQDDGGGQQDLPFGHFQEQSSSPP